MLIYTDGSKAYKNIQRKALIQKYYNTASPSFTIDLSEYKTFTSGYRNGFRVSISTYSGNKFWEGYIIGNESSATAVAFSNSSCSVSITGYTLTVAISGTPYDVNILIEY